MLVKFNSRQNVAGKYYQAGSQVMLPDRLAYTSQFKLLVRSGSVSLVAKDEATQKMQAGRDLKNHQKAQAARKITDAAISAKAAVALDAKRKKKAADLAALGLRAAAMSGSLISAPAKMPIKES